MAPAANPIPHTEPADSGKGFEMDIVDKHIELIAAVNNAKTEEQHRTCEIYLRAWRDGVAAKAGVDHWMDAMDWMHADLHHEGADAERPMCLGVFLDWQPVA